MRIFLRGLLHPSVWLLLLCGGLSLLLAHEAAARADAEEQSRTLLRAYAETVRHSGPAVPAPSVAMPDGAWARR